MVNGQENWRVEVRTEKVRIQSQPAHVSVKKTTGLENLSFSLSASCFFQGT